MANHKRLVDCSVRCNGEWLDFNVWPRKGVSDRDACLWKAHKLRPNLKCSVLRSRSIDGVKKKAKPWPPSKWPRVRIIPEK